MGIRTPIGVLGIMLLAGCTPVGQPASGPAPVAIGPDTLNVADAAIAGGDPDMALSVSESVLATDPHNVEALVHEGDAYYALDRCIPAEAAYTLALQYDPKSTASEVGMGRCLLKTNPQAAEAALERAVQDDPGNAAAFNDLGIARDLQGNFAGAVQPYQQALVNDPALTAAEVNLGLSLALSGNGAEALQYLGPLATGQTATPKIREDYAAALVASGRDDEARQVLSVDLPPDQVNSALDGFAAVIAGSQSPLPPPGAAQAVTTAPASPVPPAGLAVTAAPLPGSPPPPPAAPIVMTPPPLTSTAAYVPDNSTAAYTGPPPVPVTASSSTRGPTAALPAAAKPASPPPAAPPTAAAAFKAALKTGAPLPAPSDPPAVAADPPAAGAYMVQLAALNSQADAERQWSKISGAMPALFGGRQPDIQTATVQGRVYYRLRTGGFATKADAAKFCGEVSASGSTCTLANF